MRQFFPWEEKTFVGLILATKVIIIGLSALAPVGTFFPLGLGAVPVFRWAVNVFDSKSTNQRVHPDFFQELRMEREDAKQKADSMVDRLSSTQMGDFLRDVLMVQEFESGREWTRDDLTNGSQLQQLYNQMKNPFWNPSDFDADAFANRFAKGYGTLNITMIEYIQQANLKQLIAMSALFVQQENLYNLDDPDEINDYDELSRISCLTLAGLANQQGVFIKKI